jgi:electron transfer flavoprotein alpha subunit
MSGVLAIAETRRGELREISYEVIEAARRIGNGASRPTRVAVIDPNAEHIAAQLASRGVDEVIAVPVSVEHFEPNAWGRAIEALISQYAPAVVLGGHTADGMSWGAAVAYRTGYGFASDVTALTWADGELTAERPIHGERIVEVLEFSSGLALITLRAGVFVPDPDAAHPVARVTLNAVDVSAAVQGRHLGFNEPDRSGVDLGSAAFVLAVGRGAGDEHGFAHIKEIAEAVGATLAVSRPIIDAGWASSAHGVGQSGQSIAPRIYLALGISGAVQHLAGIRGAGTVIAVNTDPNAPIFGAADVGVVADLFQFADALQERLR